MSKRIYLDDETFELMQEIKKFYLDMEEELDLDEVSDHKHRHNNNKIDWNYVLKDSLKRVKKEYEEKNLI